MEMFAKIIVRLLILGSILFLSGCTVTGQNFQSIFINLSNSYPAIWRLVTATAYVMGFAFIVKAVYSLRIYGESRTMMSSSHSIKGPLIYFLVGAALIFSPTVYSDLLLSTFGTTQTTPLSMTKTVPGWTYQSTVAILGLVQVIGVIAFVRGWVYLARSAEQSSQPGNFGKGLSHIIGGILAINIVGTKNVIWNTLGFQ